MKVTILKSSKGQAVVKKYVDAARNPHALPSHGEWAVENSNAKKVTKIFDTQRKAITQAIKIATKQKSELVVHGKDGKIKGKNSFPPRE